MLCNECPISCPRRACARRRPNSSSDGRAMGKLCDICLRRLANQIRHFTKNVPRRVRSACSVEHELVKKANEEGDSRYNGGVRHGERRNCGRRRPSLQYSMVCEGHDVGIQCLAACCEPVTPWTCKVLARERTKEPHSALRFV
jgi:hypothetical protein